MSTTDFTLFLARRWEFQQIPTYMNYYISQTIANLNVNPRYYKITQF